MNIAGIQLSDYSICKIITPQMKAGLVGTGPVLQTWSHSEGGLIDRFLLFCFTMEKIFSLCKLVLIDYWLPVTVNYQDFHCNSVCPHISKSGGNMPFSNYNLIFSPQPSVIGFCISTGHLWKS